MILIIDNYDSFTFNVMQILKTVTDKEIRLVRNDECSVEELAALKPEYLIVSPGPGTPSQAGICEHRPPDADPRWQSSSGRYEQDALWY